MQDSNAQAEVGARTAARVQFCTFCLLLFSSGIKFIAQTSGFYSLFPPTPPPSLPIMVTPDINCCLLPYWFKVLLIFLPFLYAIMTLPVNVQTRNSNKKVIAKTVITKKSVSQGLTASTYTTYWVSREYLCLPSVNMFPYIDDMVVVSKNTPSTQQ